MKRKVAIFIFTFVAFSLIFLFRKDWNLSSKQIAEMVLIGTAAGLAGAFLMNPTRRLIENLLKR